MALFNQIQDCDFEYSKLLSIMRSIGGVFRFYDELSPNTPQFNYSYISREVSPQDLDKTIRCEEKISQERGDSFINLIFDPMLPYPGELKSLINYSYICQQVYIYDLRKSTLSLSDTDVNLLSHSSKENYLNLEANLSKSRDLKVTNRWIQKIEEEKNLETLIYKDLGRCDLFIHKNIAKLEDLEILNSSRGRGIGKKLIQRGIELAIEKKCNFIYLLSTPELGDFYTTLGFKLYLELHRFLKQY